MVHNMDPVAALFMSFPFCHICQNRTSVLQKSRMMSITSMEKRPINVNRDISIKGFATSGSIPVSIIALGQQKKSTKRENG